VACTLFWRKELAMAQPLLSPRKPTRVVELASHVRVAGRTDAGKVRVKNEDAFVVADLAAPPGPSTLGRIEVGERGVLLAVSDGMGGAAAGEVASAMTLEHLEHALRTRSPRVMPEELLREAVLEAHEAVRAESVARELSEVSRMGATLTAIHVRVGEAFIAQIGDSRAYLVRGGSITPLTHDQSMVQALLDGGVITEAESTSSPMRSVILQAIGHNDDLEVAISRLALRNRDCLVVCSDGLTNVVSEDEILSCVLSSLRLDVAVDRLVEMTLARGAPDNVTVVVAGVGGQLPPPLEPAGETLETITAFLGKIRP
jgi:serine/threonine protein phosphatase PrpC